jgi:hypothetical protein
LGFGALFISGYGLDPYGKDHDSEISYRVGVWGSDKDSASSNFRELQNLVEFIEYEGKRGKKLHNTELFMFTDNSTAEVVYYQGGSSKNKKLFELALCLRCLEMMAGLRSTSLHLW